MRAAAVLAVVLAVALALVGLGASPAAARVTSVLAVPAAVARGTIVALYGSGFPANRKLALTFGGVRAGQPRVRADGRFAAVVFVPLNLEPGFTTLTSRTGRIRVSNRVEITTGRAAPLTAEVASRGGARMRVTPSEGAVGGLVVLRAAGLPRKAAVRVTLGGQRIASGRTNAAGAFSAPLVVPDVPIGSHPLVIASARTLLRMPFGVGPRAAAPQRSALP